MIEDSVCFGRVEYETAWVLLAVVFLSLYYGNLHRKNDDKDDEKGLKKEATKKNWFKKAFGTNHHHHTLWKCPCLRELEKKRAEAKAKRKLDEAKTQRIRIRYTVKVQKVDLK